MDKEVKREALRQYFRFFRAWFLAAGILLAVCAGLAIARNSKTRGNTAAPEERVYDYADVLTDEEEGKLRSQIEKAQERLKMDIVIVTFCESVEGVEARESRVLGDYELSTLHWEYNMQSLADDFWDRNGYGYNQSFEGDGVLLLHNWYPGQNGEHLSTSGKAMKKLKNISRIDKILYKVDDYYASDPYRAYSEFIKEAEAQLGRGPIPLFVVLLAPILAAVVFRFANLSQNPAEDTAPAMAYVMNGSPVLNSQQDLFLRKHVSTRHIDRSSGGGGSGGGSHRSSSGASHGGGSHRH